MTVLIVIQGVVILLLAVLVVGLLRSHAEILPPRCTTWG